MTEQLWHKLDTDLDVLREEYIEKCREVTSMHLGGDYRTCTSCARMVIPRRVWGEIPLDVRYRLREQIARAESADRCQTCFSRAVREGVEVLAPDKSRPRSAPLPPEELLRLRRQVGIV